MPVTPESKRLEIVFKDFGGTQDAFAALLETSRSNIMRQLKGEQMISLKTIKIVCYKLGYAPAWFIMGTGHKKTKADEKQLVTEVQMLRTELDVIINLNLRLQARMEAYENEHSELRKEVHQIKKTG